MDNNDKPSLPVTAETDDRKEAAPRGENGGRHRRGRRRRGRNPNASLPASDTAVPTAGTDAKEAAPADAGDRPKDASRSREKFHRQPADPRGGASAEASAEPQEEPAAQPPAEPPVKEPKRPLYDVVGVRFRDTGKIYYFDPGPDVFPENAHVIVDTARGIEYGVVALSNRKASGREVVLPLRRILRLATPEDERRHEDNLEKETKAFNLCLSRIEAHRLDMKLVDAEYTFDNSKLLFYFTADERVDFRDLVKDLASSFRTRIELRQIGIRDEAKLMGGLGVCGRPFCCKSFLPDFVQVSIKMAKEQNLSLNSAKISGACGRLMCCLRYEYDTYVEEAALTPKVDSIVSTPDGEGVVVDSSPLKGVVKVALNKEVNSTHVYRREDVTVKGTLKKQRKAAEGEPRKPEEKKEPAADKKSSETVDLSKKV